jgi:hypothetical protein
MARRPPGLLLASLFFLVFIVGEIIYILFQGKADQNRLRASPARVSPKRSCTGSGETLTSSSEA